MPNILYGQEGDSPLSSDGRRDTLRHHRIVQKGKQITVDGSLPMGGERRRTQSPDATWLDHALLSWVRE